MNRSPQAGRVNSSYLGLLSAFGLLVALAFMLRSLSSPPREAQPSAQDSVQSADTASTEGGATSGTGVELLMHCAAGLRAPVENVVAAYRDAFGVSVQLNYGGSNTLLSQIEISKTGDLFLSADDSYTQLARDKGLIREVLPLALMRPVIAVKRGNPKQIQSLADLLRPDVIVALGNPDQAAIGKDRKSVV